VIFGLWPRKRLVPGADEAAPPPERQLAGAARA